MSFKWFIVQASSNSEKVAQRNLLDRIKRFAAEEHFGEVLVPVQEIVEMKNGQKKKTERKLYPNYMFVEINVTDELISSEAWHIVRETPKVSGFIGGTKERPLPMSDREAEQMLSRVRKATEAPTVKNQFEKGQTVRVSEGPFTDFHGVVEEMDPAHGKVKVSVLVFGRATSVDFASNQLTAVDADVDNSKKDKKTG